MDIVKKNLVSIICGVVALLAAISLMWPVAGMYDDVLNKDLNPSIKDGTTLVGLRRQVRLMPLLSPDELEQKPLTQFPTQDIIKAGRDAVAKVGDQSQEMMLEARNINGPHVLPDGTAIHEPLVDGCLPDPSVSAQYNFVKIYQAQVTNLKEWKDICNPNNPPGTDDAHADQSVTSDELTAALNQLKLDITNKLWPQGGKIDVPTTKLIEDEFNAAAPSVRPKLDRLRADATTIYLEKDALPIDPNIALDKPYPKPEEIWDAQLTFWVLDDVCRALSRANQSDTLAQMPNVRDAAVKRIVNITSPTPILASTATLMESALKSGEDNTAVLDPNVSVTGHVCNALYDVVDFKATLIVDAASLPKIMRELEKSQFITVLGLSIDDVPDLGVSAVKGYVYGKQPVLQIEVDCEEIFMKKWTKDLLPPTRQFGLGPAKKGAP